MFRDGLLRPSARANTITLDVVQVNLAVTRAGAKPIPDMLAEAKEA